MNGYTGNYMPQYPVVPAQQYSMPPMQQYSMPPMQQYSMPPMQQYPMPPMQQYPMPPMQQHPMTQNYWPPMPIHSPPFSQKIILFTMPVSALKTLGIKKPIDIVAHWTICINGMCYELARQSNKKEPYTYKATVEREFRAKRASQGKQVEEAVLGDMAMPYSHQMIDEVGECLALVSGHGLEYCP
jgi:hypothetical protein